MDLHKEKNVLLDKRKIDLEILEYLLVFQKEQKGVLFFYFLSRSLKLSIEERFKGKYLQEKSKENIFHLFTSKDFRE